MAHATIWSLPNFSGELFTADATQTPFLSMIGGLTGGLITGASEFTTGQLYSHPPAIQPSISENASVTAPAASHVVRTQSTNVVQIHQETIDLTYVKLSSSGQMSGINVAGQEANPIDDKTWQFEQKLIKIARDIEHSFISGQFNKATNAGEANRTRGMIQLAQTSGAHIAANNAPLSKSMLNNLYRAMADGGAVFQNPVMFLSAGMKQQVTDIYNLIVGFALPASRNIGGLDIQEIEFDFGKMGIVWNRFMPNNAVLIADVAYCAPVFQEVPGKGVLFVESLAKTGASDREQIYGQIGLDHGPGFMHGAITGLLPA